MGSRILICSLGSIGKRHLNNVLCCVPEAEIAVLRTQGPAISLPGVGACFQSLEEAKSFRPKTVIIASPASLHLLHAQTFAGIAEQMLIEKPLASTVEQARELQHAVGTRCRVIVGYNLRYWLPLQRFRQLVLEKRHGTLIRLEAHVGQHLSTWRAGADPSSNVSCHRELGGGVFRELSHEIDYCLWICGVPDGVRARKSRHFSYGDVEDNVDLWLDFPGGAHAAIHMDMIDRTPRRVLRAICEEATFELNFLTRKISVNGETEAWDNEPTSDTYRLELEDLLHGRTEALGATCQDAISVLKVIEAAERDSA